MYQNDHPVGGAAIVSCGGTYNWDCTGGNTTAITMSGPASSQFLVNYPGILECYQRGFGTFGSGKDRRHLHHLPRPA